MTPVLVFDIETVPDVAGIRRVHVPPVPMSDDELMAWYGQQRRTSSGSEFTPHALQKVVAISCALREGRASRSHRSASRTIRKRS